VSATRKASPGTGRKAVSASRAEPLGEYRRKRDASRTPEPVPKPARSSPAKRRGKGDPAAPIFVIQEHHASSLHWDFRLEHHGALVSWALPKGLPVDPKQNHLAVHTEDHPMEYATFAGEIPAGEYGGGQVTIWDHGTYQADKWTDREVSVTLEGKRASGHFVLFQTKGTQWMIHRKDPPPDGWQPMPSSVAPMLATPGPLPEGPGWAYEFKWDGIRAGVAVEGGRVSMWSRGGGELTSAFPEVRGLGEDLGSTAAFLDGELVVFNAEGRPDFGLIQHRLRVDDPRKAARLAKQSPANLVLFDLLYLDGQSLVDLPYRDRRRQLEVLGPRGPHWAVTPSFTDTSGEEVMRAAKEAGLEGVVSKRIDSHYRPGKRSGEWIKTKLANTQEVLIGGFTAGNGSRRDTFGALLLGVPEEEGLQYVGRVGTGFSRADREELVRRLRPLERKTSPFHHGPRAEPGVVWTRPSLVGEVQFSEWTHDGVLRHPSWRGLRRDKSPSQVVRES
jgi:bifunctional non-homologous end joining protein LigD